MPGDDYGERSIARAKARRAFSTTPPATAPSAPREAPPAAAPAPSPAPSPAAPPAAPPAPAPSPAPAMVDVGGKPLVLREAVAEGFLRLKAETLRALAEGRAPKGDPLPVARVAGIMAAKGTPDLIPLCHPIPLASVEVDLWREERGVRARATVRATWSTGVEMEALCAVSAALLTVWDMTKALEKDASGNYPDTAIEAVRVLRKTKGAAP